MNKYKKLLKNSGIFAIANLGSKLISIILIPLYTYILTTNEYGSIDMIMTTVSLIMPLITLNIFEATLRFSVKSKHSKSEVLTNSLVIALGGLILLAIISPLIYKVEIFNVNIILIYLLVLLQALNLVFSQFARGIGKVGAFAINGLLNTAITLGLNILFLVKLNMHIDGYILSIIIANLICNIYLFISLEIRSFTKLSSMNKEVIKNMVIYSIPLIPNSLMWWIMNASDRYAISYFLGVEANGIYALAYKVPTVLNILSSIFFQAWQLSAIEEKDSKLKDEFYSKVFNMFLAVMIISTSGILVVTKLLFKLIIAPEFYSAWRYVPFLLLSVVFCSFSSFLGTNYVAMEETKGAFKTTLIGGIVNIVLNFITIPIIGINGAALSTMISFFIVWILRCFDTRKFVEIKVDMKNMIINGILIALQIIVLYYVNNKQIIYQVILFVVLLAANREVIIVSLSKAKEVIMKKIKK